MFFKFNKSERIAIRWALSKPKPWDVDGRNSAFRKDPRSATITSLKKRLKQHHLDKQKLRCCYCKTLLKSRSIETDREHVIPKDNMPSLSYHPFNLSVSCKTCNMTVKSTRVEHLPKFRKSGALLSKDLSNQRNYNIVHPNIHDWSEHLELLGEETSEGAVRIYYPLTRRGRFTYEFFKLKALQSYQNTQKQKSAQTKKISRQLHPGVIEREVEHGQRR